MKCLYKTLATICLFSSLIFGAEKKVLVEILTNSHCPLCPPAHSAIDNYLQSGNGAKINFIYYHMAFPYPSDELYQHNTSDAAAKNNFYGPHSSTPKAYFDGNLVTNSYSNWTGSLDALLLEESSYELILSGNFTENDFTINAEITKTGDQPVNDLTINYVVVENLSYQGNNGINNHKNVMRKIVNPQGDTFDIDLNETVSLSTTIIKNSEWDTNNLSIIAFIQDRSNKKVFQSASISYSDLSLTDVESPEILSNNFNLKQNYPNPFNPTTNIEYIIPSNTTKSISYVQLTVYDILGNKAHVLVDEEKRAGHYEITFDGSSLAGGVYFYQLRIDNLVLTKKMILLK